MSGNDNSKDGFKFQCAKMTGLKGRKLRQWITLVAVAAVVAAIVSSFILDSERLDRYDRIVGTPSEKFIPDRVKEEIAAERTTYYLKYLGLWIVIVGGTGAVARQFLYEGPEDGGSGQNESGSATGGSR